MGKLDKKMIYDEEEDILSLSKGTKVKASIDVGDFIIDVDYKGFVAGIEILNASQNLGLTGGELRSLEKASMGVTYKPNCVYVAIVMKLKQGQKDITIPLTVDLGHGSVKTEKTQFVAS